MWVRDRLHNSLLRSDQVHCRFTCAVRNARHSHLLMDFVIGRVLVQDALNRSCTRRDIDYPWRACGLLQKRSERLNYKEHPGCIRLETHRENALDRVTQLLLKPADCCIVDDGIKSVVRVQLLRICPRLPWTYRPCLVSTIFAAAVTEDELDTSSSTISYVSGNCRCWSSSTAALPFTRQRQPSRTCFPSDTSCAASSKPMPPVEPAIPCQ